MDDDQAQCNPSIIHYYRELGPTAIAPGHKQISVKIQQQQPHNGAATKYPSQQATKLSAQVQTLPAVIEDPDTARIPSLFDNETSLPVEDVLPDLLDAFFYYYTDNFCFLNRSYLNNLVSRGESSTFLICSMAAVSSRFCNSSKFAKYFRPKEDGSL